MKTLKKITFIKQVSFIGLAGLFLLIMTTLAAANPNDIHLTTFEDFDQAYAQGLITPVTQWNEGLEGLHPKQMENFRPSQLYILEHLITEAGAIADPRPGVLMAWGSPQEPPGQQIIAAWDLKLPVDPDLTNMCITLTAWPRTGMTSISFSLKDVNGVMKGWNWLVGPGGFPPDVPTTITINASGGPGQAGAVGFWDGGIDLTQVVGFEFDESGIAQGGIPLPNNLPGFVGQWNYWHDIFVFPCPVVPVKPEHFTCYSVYEERPFRPIKVFLQDQFLKQVAYVVRPKEICTPAIKNGEPMLNPVDHLVCYEVVSYLGTSKTIVVKNQFGEQKLFVKSRLQKLCVPSYKEVIQPQP